jgi:hypothetical protein
MDKHALTALGLVAFLCSCGGEPPPDHDGSDDVAPATRVGERIDFLEKITIGDPPAETPPWIANLAIVDLDQDGLLDVVLCDVTKNEIAWIRQAPASTFTEIALSTLVVAPAHVTPGDVDLDGDLDLLIAEMGQILPSNEKIGTVTLLENQGDETFEHRTLLDGVARVTDIQPGDFDGDGDIDLAVGQFGYDQGEIRWMENRGGGEFESHQLLSLPGTIHVPVDDMDGDGDLDITALVSQTWEQVYVFENDGAGNFESHIAYGSTNEDFGSSGISLSDLDQDGDPDVLYTNGDAFDYVPSLPRPWHGVQWLENEGGLEFTYHRLADFPGAFSADAADADGDGDLDVFVVSMFADWSDPEAAAIGWLENDGRQQFTLRTIDSRPTHQVVLDAGDLDGDGWADVVTGGMYSHEPFDSLSRVTWWRNRWSERRQ